MEPLNFSFFCLRRQREAWWIIKKIAVIGAGISGLAAAYQLQKRGYEVIVFERTNLPGGRMRTDSIEGYTWDAGAQFMIDSYNLMKDLMKELGLCEHMTYVDPVQAIVLGDAEIYRFPSFSLSGLLRHPKLDIRSKLVIWKLVYQGNLNRKYMDFDRPERLAPLDDLRDLSWWRKKTTDDLVDWLLHIPTSSLFFWLEKETPWFYALFNLLDKKAQRIFTPKGGMGSIPKALSQRLDIQYNVSVVSVESVKSDKVKVTCKSNLQQSEQLFDRAIVAVPAEIAMKMIPNHCRELGEERSRYLAETRYVSNLTTAIGYNDLPETSAYGIGVPFKLHSPLASIGWEHLKGQERVRRHNGLAVAMPTHEYCQNNWGSDSEGISGELIDAVNRYYPGSKDAVEFSHVYRWKYAMPVMYPGRTNQLQRALEAKQPQGSKVFTCGDYWAGPCTEHALVSGYRAVQEVVDSLYNE
ncbi:protoporphyrinogen/coproporphyrinogen oxidase [Paenibacillus sedimenti]|uniref:FAD-dependent oxidoreductase n=1 Tax=Paenibacillus sedimenti TaxID=2770274 RepID=A0A926KSZ2_9BACL|nr:FAD-dependent oxidoreductase [Paenibacillus sedimenti]MBD0382591.1 FAD-dependent oxidoreductase [Paenibacillus sedimenti]